MPPKKKKEPIIINGVDITSRKREQLEEFVHLLREEMEREREERNYFQLERDKLQTLWQITREQLDESRAKLRNKERHMEESEEKHQVQIQQINQQVKHLLYLQECNLKDLEAVLMKSLADAKCDYLEVQKELLQEKKELKIRLMEQELANEEEMQNLIIEQEDEIRRISAIHFDRLRKKGAEYEKSLAIQKENLYTRHEMELVEIAERKHEHVLQLKENHTRDFSEVNDYYNTVVLKNLSLIKSIKEQTKEIKNKEIPIKKEIAEVRKINKKLVHPLQEAQSTAADRIRRMNNYEKDKMSLKNTQICLAKYVEEKTNLLRQHITLESEFEKLQEEVFVLRNNFFVTLSETKRKKEFKNVTLEKKVQKIQDKIDETDADMNDMLTTSKLDPATVVAVNEKLEDILQGKNRTIEQLQYKLCKASKRHDDLLVLYESKLQQLGIPKEELGLVPLKTNVMSHAPAGLVTHNR